MKKKTKFFLAMFFVSMAVYMVAPAFIPEPWDAIPLIAGQLSLVIAGLVQEYGNADT